MTVQHASAPPGCGLDLLTTDPAGFLRRRRTRPALWASGHDHTTWLSEADVHGILSHSSFPASATRMAKDGAFLPADRYTTATGGPETRVADADAVWSEFRRGGTVILRNLERVHPPLGELCAALAEELGAPVDAGCYLTPPSSTAFCWHADPQETLILQMSGTKAWQVCDGRYDLHREGITLGDRPDQPLLVDDTLRPGDVLYMPVGYPHAASAVERSLHVTIAIWS